MVSTKLFLVIALVMIGAAASTILTCGGVNNDNTKTKSKSTCNAETDSDARCCYQSYQSSGATVEGCVPVLNAAFDDFESVISNAKSTNPSWENYRLDCAQSHITISFLVLAILAFLF